MPKKRRYTDLTDHPSVFRETYWGNFDADNLPDAQIVANRNAFAVEHAVTGFVGGEIPESQDRMYDHPELYRCENGYVYIVSPYDADSSVDERAAAAGMTRCSPLYHPRATTYIREFSGKREFNAWRKTH